MFERYYCFLIFDITHSISQKTGIRAYDLKWLPRTLRCSMCRMISTCVGLDVCSLLQQFLHKVLLRQDKLLVEMSTEEKDDLSLRATSNYSVLSSKWSFGRCCRYLCYVSNQRAYYDESLITLQWKNVHFKDHHDEFSKTYAFKHWW